MLKKDAQSTPSQHRRSREPEDNNYKRVTVENKQKSNSVNQATEVQRRQHILRIQKIVILGNKNKKQHNCQKRTSES